MAKFFSKHDWAAFWLATLVSFGVYFYTLGPSVGLEDSGELATAAAHLGVPHPPGYPFWTFCSWIFCKLFSFVTYMGHPTPAWAVSLCSAVFGALAAGCTAMLICRSARDLVSGTSASGEGASFSTRIVPWLCLSGGVGGSLAFAFSPVEWSQSTIVEIYSLNALFLMLVFLVAYWWMRRPSNKVLCAAAFAFGLGLTNYQVLLYAIVPLTLIIAFRNIRMFRDFALYLIPALLTGQILVIGGLDRMSVEMSHDTIEKHAPFGMTDAERALENPDTACDFATYLSDAKRWRSVIAGRSSDPLRADEAERLAEMKARLENKIAKVRHGDPEAFQENERKSFNQLIAEIQALPGPEVEKSYDYRVLREEIRNRRGALDKLTEELRLLEEQKVADKRRRALLKSVPKLVSKLSASQAEDLRQRFEAYQKDDLRQQLAEQRDKVLTGFESGRLSGARKDQALAFLKEVDAMEKQLIHFRYFSGDRQSCSADCPSQPGLVIGFLLFFGGLIAAWCCKRRRNAALAVKALLAGCGASVFCLIVSSTLLTHGETWCDAVRHDVTVVGQTLATAPLIDPIGYVWIAICILVSVTCGILSAMDECPLPGIGRVSRGMLWIASAVAGLAAVGVAFNAASSTADLAALFGYTGEPYPWTKSILLFSAFIVALFAISTFVKNGLSYAIPVASFHIAVFVLLTRGAMNGLTHPGSWWFWWPFIWNFVLFGLAWFVLPYGRAVVGAAFFTQLGAAFYAYMPIVSDWRNPPMNWGYPRTWEGFKHAVERGQYEKIKGAGIENISHLWYFAKEQLWYYVRDVKLQFSSFLVALALVPFASWRFSFRVRGRVVTVRMVWLALAAVALTLIRADLGLAILGVAAVLGIVLVMLHQCALRPMLVLRRSVEGCLRHRDFVPLAGLATLVALIILVPLAMSFGMGGSLQVVRGIAAVIGFLLLALYFIRPVVAFMNAHGIGRLAFEARPATLQWLIASSVCFVMMSFILMYYAKIEGDVQDGFIQKVKFISSHAMIAVWIGYGLVFLAVQVLRHLPSRLRMWAVAPMGLAVVLVAALPPLVRNYTNDRLVVELGGAEQNGHTFGWQFGAYQLDGAKAIREQLTADEEPLPDPEWPAPMEDHAIFFGGTDPGRFVPTYMIYSADYRPDVYLITQNALADETYMAVERDLYGDDIWIPAKEDNGEAFRLFVGSLSDEDKKQFGVDESNGRVQVNGALSVMKINELLVKMMFDANKDRHAFYLEESYPIDWMREYLVPHGLILRIPSTMPGCDATSAAWNDTLRKDRDFWDWYTRRLTDDPMYRRDFAAQKSFGKLRSAIAGSLQGHLIEGQVKAQKLIEKREFVAAQNAYDKALPFMDYSEQAFREACILAPISPESTTQYLQLFWTERANTWARKSKNLARLLSDKPSEQGLAEMRKELGGDWRLAPYALSLTALDVIEDLLVFVDGQDPYNRRTLRIWPDIKAWRTVYDTKAQLDRFDGVPEGEADRETYLALTRRLAEAYRQVVYAKAGFRQSAEYALRLEGFLSYDADRLEKEIQKEKEKRNAKD